MSRHGKNNCASAFFTSAERAMLKNYGTQKLRVGKDSLKTFDCCSLCLHPVKEPLCCPKGHLYCKECIYENMVEQKQAAERQLRKWESQEKRLKVEETTKLAEDRAKALDAFDKVECGLLPASHEQFPGERSSAKRKLPAGYTESAPCGDDAVYSEAKLQMLGQKMPLEDAHAAKRQKMLRDESRELPSFWVPSLTPHAEKTLLQKPDQLTYCLSSSKHPLSFKQLIKVDFSTVKSVEYTDKNHVKGGRYQCPVCCKVLSNSHQPAVLKKCGHVMCVPCLEKMNKECLVCSKKFKTKHIIRLETFGTGFAAKGGLEVSRAGIAFM